MLMPFSGIVGPSLRMSKGALQYAAPAISLASAGVKASAIWGYLTSIFTATSIGGGGSLPTGGGGGGGSGGDADGGPGVWEPETQTGWSAEAQTYQFQITGRQGLCYRVRGLKFDGWDKARRVLLDAKDNYSWQLEGGTWAKWYPQGPDEWAKLAKGEFEAAKGTPVEWHFSQKEMADIVRPIVSKWVKVIHTPRAF